MSLQPLIERQPLPKEKDVTHTSARLRGLNGFTIISPPTLEPIEVLLDLNLGLDSTLPTPKTKHSQVVIHQLRGMRAS